MIVTNEMIATQSNEIYKAMIRGISTSVLIVVLSASSLFLVNCQSKDDVKPDPPGEEDIFYSCRRINVFSRETNPVRILDYAYSS